MKQLFGTIWSNEVGIYYTYGYFGIITKNEEL